MLASFGFLLITLIVFIFRRVFTVTKVQGESMYPLLKHDDRLLVLRHWPVRWLRIGQIVTCCPSLHNIQLQSNDTLFIKQLIGLPGDKVMVHVSELDETRRKLLLNFCDQEGNLTWFIPSDYCFVKGQSSTSIDSITWGPIPLNSLVGIVCFRLWRYSKSINLNNPVSAKENIHG